MVNLWLCGGPSCLFFLAHSGENQAKATSRRIARRRIARRGSIFGSIFGAGLLLFLGSACYVEPTTPSTFRFRCDEPKDCPPSQSCAHGLCQRPCTLGEKPEPRGDCESESALCVNGFCSPTCSPSSENPCPAPQSCLEIPKEVLKSPTGNALGVCTRPCKDAEQDCPAMNLCISGFCLPKSAIPGAS